MKPVTAQAMGSVRIERKGGSPISLGASTATCDAGSLLEAGAIADRRAICGIHSRAASTAGIAQTPNAQRQDPPTTDITGTVSPEATAAPRNSAVEYRPIIRPARCEKSLLIAVGSSTLPTAIAAPTSTVPERSA